jgi:hypothetical protein
VVLLSYLALLLILALVGMWLVRASRVERLIQQIDSFLIEKQDHLLIGLLFLWFAWFAVNESLFIPARVTRGVNSALYVFSFSLLLLIASEVTLNAGIMYSHLLIPLSVLSFYCVFMSFLLPAGVSKTFLIQTAKIILPITILLFILYFFFNNWRMTKPQLIRATKVELNPGDVLLPLLPLTPVVQYLINNSEILLWWDYIVIILIFLLFGALLIFVIPLLFKNTGATRALMFLGVGFAFLITNMPSLTKQYNWFQEGSLQIQLLILLGIWLISWIIYNSKFRSILYLLIAVNFISNTIVQFTDQDVKQPPSRDQSDNMLVRMVDSREPVITPNIYLLVYDSYVVNETMLAYGIDNQDQEQYLQGLDFKIYPDTYSIDSNSIGSMSRVLNVSIDYYGNIRRGVSGDGVVQNLLEDYDYKTYGIFPRGFFFWGLIPSYDYFFPGSGSSIGLLTKAIYMGELRFDIEFEVVPREDFVHDKRRVFSNVTDEPRFIDTHSNLPGHTQDSGACRPNEIELYKERLDQANIEMREDLALIIENDPDAVVIVSGDHGPHLTKNCYQTGEDYDISEITRLDIQDRNGTFLAIRWPTEDFDEYDDITILQDIFPAVFAYIFEDPDILQSKIEPTTVNGMKISGAEVSNGIIVGGRDDGEPLYP